jgi:hypothetical protein
MSRSVRVHDTAETNSRSVLPRKKIQGQALGTRPLTSPAPAFVEVLVRHVLGQYGDRMRGVRIR